MHSTRSRHVNSPRSPGLALPLVALAAAVASLFALGCGSDSLDGSPTCGSKNVQLTGTVDGTAVNVSDSYTTGGLSQGDMSTIAVTLSSGGEVDLDWNGIIPDGQTQFVTALASFPGLTGGAICSGGQVELSDNTATFIMTSLTYCEDSSAVTGQINGCVSFQ